MPKDQTEKGPNGPDGPDEPHPVVIKMIPRITRNIPVGFNMHFSPCLSAHKFVFLMEKHVIAFGKKSRTIFS